MLADAAQDLQSRGEGEQFPRQLLTNRDQRRRRRGATGEGELWVKRPNLFNWHMTSPDESVLVSDGQTLWFYNPFVEQVTATAEERHRQYAVYADHPQ